MRGQDLDQGVTYTVNVHHEDGIYWAAVVEVLGCFASGDTEEKLWQALSEALGFVLSTPQTPVVAEFDAQRSAHRVERRQAEVYLSRV